DELEQCVTRDAVGAESMKNGFFESARARNLGIGMQRIEIAAQAVDQRRMRLRSRCGRAAEAAVAAQESAARNFREQSARGLVADLARRIQQRAFACPLVDE